MTCVGMVQLHFLICWYHVQGILIRQNNLLIPIEQYTLACLLQLPSNHLNRKKQFRVQASRTRSDGDAFLTSPLERLDQSYTLFQKKKYWLRYTVDRFARDRQ